MDKKSTAYPLVLSTSFTHITCLCVNQIVKNTEILNKAYDNRREFVNESILSSDVERARGFSRKVAEDYVCARLYPHQLLPILTVKVGHSTTAYLSQS